LTEKLEITLVFFKRYSKEDIKEEWLFVPGSVKATEAAT
jgi:hypothetical protein